MRHNIIAILVFVGFIATVFTLGYVTSRDTMPLYQGHTPQINTAGGQSVDRFSGMDQGLNTPSMQPVTINTQGGSYNGSGSTSEIGTSGNYGGGYTMHTTSSQSLHSVGGGGTSGGGSSNSKTAANNGTNSTIGGSFSVSPSLSFNRRNKENMSITADDYINTMHDQDYTLELAGGSGSGGPGIPDDPFPTPVGGVPYLLTLILSVLYAIRSYRKRR